jgi:hypothetical protein
MRCWEWFCESKFVPQSLHNPNRLQYFLDPVNLMETAIQYTSDYAVLKTRYGEEDRIQPPKIAGLMASSISRYKPIVFRDGIDNPERLPLNELLAIFNGIFICGEFPLKGNNCTLSSFTKDVFFGKWLNDFLHLLVYRNYTAENLVLVYETFCMNYCREALVKVE